MENIRALTFAKYGLWNYLFDDYKNTKPYNELAQIGRNLRGLMKVLVLKRLESSIFAFKRTIEKLLTIHEYFYQALEAGLSLQEKKLQSYSTRPRATTKKWCWKTWDD